MRIAIVALCAGMALSLTLYVLSRWTGFAAAHAGLALSTSFTACLNAALLLRRLRRDAVFVPAPGWSGFGLRLLLANAVMALVALGVAGPLDAWIAAPRTTRWLHLGGVIAAAAFAYFATLALAGLKPAHLRRR
jgi:putative peptidoglycan lipid II flippase